MRHRASSQRSKPTRESASGKARQPPSPIPGRPLLPRGVALLRSEPDLGRRADRSAVAGHDGEGVLACAPVDVGREAVAPQVPGASPGAERFARVGVALGEADRCSSGIGPVAAERLRDATRAVRVVEGELAEDAGTQHRDVLSVRTRRGRDEQARPVRRREDQRVDVGLLGHLARRVAEVEAGDRLEPPLARKLRRTFGLRKRPRLVDLRAAEDAPIARCDRLCHRRGRAKDVDDDADRRRSLISRSESDVHEHAARLIRMATTETRLPTCYRHPDRETGLSCSECGRPICTECMTPAAVGLRCPDHAGNRRGARVVAKRGIARAPQMRRGSTEALVTKSLIAINVAIYLVTAVQGNGINAPGGELFAKMWLDGPDVANGDWWRLITAAFLHASLLHIGFNMLALWWFGAPVEEYLGRARFIGLYLVSGLDRKSTRLNSSHGSISYAV